MCLPESNLALHITVPVHLFVLLLLLLLLFGRSLPLLAHLSTKCSVSFCDPSMSGVRRPSSVRPSVRPSTISLGYISSETAY